MKYKNLINIKRFSSGVLGYTKSGFGLVWSLSTHDYFN